MNNKAILPIIKATKNALSVPETIQPLKIEKPKRAKPPIYDLSEKNWNSQIDEIITGKKEAKENEKEKR